MSTDEKRAIASLAKFLIKSQNLYVQGIEDANLCTRQQVSKLLNARGNVSGELTAQILCHLIPVDEEKRRRLLEKLAHYPDDSVDVVDVLQRVLLNIEGNLPDIESAIRSFKGELSTYRRNKVAEHSDGKLQGPHLHVPLIEFSQDEPTQALNFETRCPNKLVGRDKSLSQLKDFLRPSTKDGRADVRWWIMTGPQGSGKSRLAVELCEYARRSKFNAGFLLHGDQSSWKRALDDWFVETDTLIIIDDSVNNLRDARQLIKDVNVRDGARVRILLTETTYNAPIDRWWLTSFGHIESPLLNIILSRAYSETGEQLVDLSDLKALRIEGVSDGDAHEIYHSILDEFDIRSDLRPTNDVVQKFIATSGIKGLPAYIQLYALETVETLKLGRTVNSIGKGRLTRTYLERQMSRKIEQENVNSSMLNLITLATVLGGIQPSEIEQACRELKSPSSGRHLVSDDYCIATYHNVTFHRGSDFNSLLLGLEPNILGEAYVLSRLEGNPLFLSKENPTSVVNDTRQIFEYVYAKFPEKLLRFAYRCLRSVLSEDCEFRIAWLKLIQILSELAPVSFLQEHDVPLDLLRASIISECGFSRNAIDVIDEFTRLHSSVDHMQTWLEIASYQKLTFQQLTYVGNDAIGESTSDTSGISVGRQKMHLDIDDAVELVVKGGYAEQFLQHAPDSLYTKYVEHIDSRFSPETMSIEDVASLATYMMITAWGSTMQTFGPSPAHPDLPPVMEADRREFLSAVLRANSHSVVLKKSYGDFKIVFTEDGVVTKTLQMGRTSGVGIIFPLTQSFADDYLTRRKSLYHLGETEIREGKIVASHIATAATKGPITLLVDLAFHFYGLDELYELKQLKLRQEAVSNSRRSKKAGILDQSSEGFKLGNNAGGIRNGFQVLIDQLIAILAWDRERHATQGQPWQRPRIIIPFTGNGLGEAYITNMWSRQTQLFGKGKKQRSQNHFVKQDYLTVDGDMIYELDWARFMENEDRFTQRLRRKLESYETI